jgi:2-polyprenyl-3-methyl-5-hydroxy-6-metoxy-1,4-benzoquinol methylase
MTEARAAYDDWHARHEVDTEANSPWHQVLKPELGDLSGKRVLEIGCGRGGFAVWLATHSKDRAPAEVVASDFSPVAVRLAEEFGRTREVTNVTYRVGDLMGLDWPDARFDVAISCETIEHVPDSRRALSELARVLKPGGRLFLTFPNYMNLLGLHRLYRPLTGRTYTEGGQPINHFLLYPRVRRWVRATGLTIERTRGAGHYLPFPRRPPIRLGFLDRLPLKPFAAHPVIVARKPG